MDVRVEPPMMDNRIYGVSGRKQDFQVRLTFDGLVGKLSAVHSAGHHNVGEKEIDLVAAAHNVQGRCSIRGRQHLVTEVGQDLDRVFAQRLVVFDDEDGFGAESPIVVDRTITIVRLFALTVVSREVDLDGCAFVDFAVDRHVAG